VPPKQCGEKANKDSTVHYSYRANARGSSIACGSQATINVASDVIDMITDNRSHDESAVSLKKEREY